MNRIILIGNGFDLAHGLKTNYSDFIEDLFDEIYKHIELKTENELISDLISFNKNDSMFYKDLSFEENKNTKREKYLMLKKFNPNKNILEHNLFLKSFLSSNKNLNWGAIENIYYEKLLSIVNNSLYDLPRINFEIDELNEDFEVIINLLENYLTRVEKSTINSVNESILNNLNKAIEAHTISVNHISELAKKRKEKAVSENSLLENYSLSSFVNQSLLDDISNGPKFTLVVNFNYTNTFEMYIKEMERTDLIYIHGKLNEIENNITFGFGDEIDLNYTRLENLNLNNAMSYIKSVKYLKTENYRKILEFISYDNFQVYIMGHSCSNTDRTLLNKIFEHENCKSIIPFYYKDDKGNNWDDLIKNITRIFTDKNKLRDRVVNFKYCHPLKS